MGFKIMKIFKCELIHNLKIVPRIKCLIITSVIVFFIMNAIIISSIIYFQSFYIYSYFINRVDIHEFDELSEIELYLENTEIVFQEKLKDIATVVALRVEDTYNNNEGNIGDYTIPQDVTAFVEFYQGSKLFPFMKEDYVDFKLMIVDTMGDKWKVNGDSDGEIIDENRKVVEMYVHMLIKYSRSNITLLQNLFSDNIPPFKNVSQLPIYTEYIPKDIKNVFFNNDEDKDKDKNGEMYQSVILSFVPNKDNSNNNKFYFSHIVFLFSNLNVINNIYEEILSYNPGLSILKTNYLFPYETHNPKYCINALYLNTLTIPSSFISPSSSTTINYIDNCFDALTPITKYASHPKHKHKTSLDEFLSTFNLHNRSYITNNPGERELTSIIHQAELSTMRYNQTALTQTLNHILPINNKDYKVKKSISPITAAFQFHHYYPINTLSTIYLIKDQGLSDFVTEDIHNEMITHVLGCITYIILLSIASIVLIMILLTSFLNKLRTWMLTLKSITTSDVNVKQHTNKNTSVNVNEDIDIDELNELTQKVSEIIKGDIEFKPHYTKLEETENKLSIERLNLETQMVKRGNIIVKEQDIQTLLEESNCTSEITKRDLMTIKHDKFVKKSLIFTALIDDYENATRNNNASANDDKDKDTMTIGSIMNMNISRRNSIKVHHYTKLEGDYVFDKESLQNKQNILYQDYKEMFSKL